MKHRYCVHGFPYFYSNAQFTCPSISVICEQSNYNWLTDHTTLSTVTHSGHLVGDNNRQTERRKGNEGEWHILMMKKQTINCLYSHEYYTFTLPISHSLFHSILVRNTQNGNKKLYSDGHKISIKSGEPQ